MFLTGVCMYIILDWTLNGMPSEVFALHDCESKVVFYKTEKRTETKRHVIPTSSFRVFVRCNVGGQL